MIINLYTETYFKSAHKLDNYDGVCSRLHGHTWKICLWVKGEETHLDKVGILWDFNNLNEITSELDHRYLNEIVDFNPTAENLSLYIYRKLKEGRPELDFKVRVYESLIDKKAYCELGDF
ncbi:MAG: 6-carboxytetrahydropterin synthase [Victivallales bacterium]|nr:6-carboxytetrahydropterin synthase [Victivallales bacterium]MCF7888649.1 6-carboxytetrahydropterin synthase [Victivallales bacterium]